MAADQRLRLAKPAIDPRSVAFDPDTLRPVCYVVADAAAIVCVKSFRAPAAGIDNPQSAGMVQHNAQVRGPLIRGRGARRFEDGNCVLPESIHAGLIGHYGRSYAPALCRKSLFDAFRNHRWAVVPSEPIQVEAVDDLVQPERAVFGQFRGFDSRLQQGTTDGFLVDAVQFIEQKPTETGGVL